ncbi:MAG: hypothetical protein INH13_25625 [Cupriavidus sp.]|nr:hypothetical protein [Cupriavidus sp.]
MNIVSYLADRGKEPSTWRGLTMLITALGIAIQPELVASIAAVGMAVSGLVGVLAKGK